MTNLFNNYQLPPKKSLRGGQRADLIKQIYKLYEEDEISRKKENWKRYIKWLKESTKRDSIENQQIFRRTNLFIRKIPISSFCFLLSSIKNGDLFVLLSIAKDHKARGFNVSGYIASHFSKVTKQI